MSEHLTVGQLAMMEATLRRIFEALDHGDGWEGHGKFRQHQEGADVRSVVSSTTPVELLPASHVRDEALIWNASTATLYVLFGKLPSTTNYTLQISAGNWAIIDNYYGPLWGVWGSQNGYAQCSQY